VRRSNLFPIAIGTAVCFLLPLPSRTATWYVDCSVHQSGDGTSPETAFKTIQHGIDAASNGDTVIVAQGTYVQNVQIKGENILLRSKDPLDPTVVANTIIDGDRKGSVVVCESLQEATLEGLTITNGLADKGGGISCTACSLTLRRCTITENEATWSGGGAYASTDSSLTFEDCQIADDTSEWYGGGAAMVEGPSAVLRNSAFSRNSATEDVAEGTALYCEDGSLEMTDCIISDNFGDFSKGHCALPRVRSVGG